MKKFLFSLVAIGMSLSFASCNSEEDLPTPVVPDNQTSLEATFPKGSTVKQIQVSIPNEVRTRAGETDIVPDWDMFNNEDGCLYVHYAVYNSDGSLYYQSDFAGSTFTTTTKDISITFPVNSEDNRCSLFVWADKDKELNQGISSYKIDWENKTVSLSDYAGLNIEHLGKLGDAWYVRVSVQGEDYFDPNTGSHSLVMKRPFMQVNLISDETQIKAVYDKFIESGVKGQIGFNTGNQGGVMYLPKTWHWQTDEIDFELPKYGNNNFYLRPEDEHPKVYIAGLGRELDYVASVYFFAPNSGEFKDAATGRVMDKLVFNVQGGGKNDAYSLSSFNLNANTRIFLMNSELDTPGGGNGILTPGDNLEILTVIDNSWNGDNPFDNLQEI